MRHVQTRPLTALLVVLLALSACSDRTSNPLAVEPGAASLQAVVAAAGTGCTVAVDDAARTVSLLADCSTTASLIVPDGFTLQGNGHTVTAVGGFAGPYLVRNAEGASFIGVKDVVLTADIPVLRCAAIGGIGLLGASGTISDVTVRDVRRGGVNGCNGTVGIFVENRSGGAPTSVTVVNSVVENFLRTGIRVQGNVSANVNRNRLVAMDGVDDHTSPNAVAFAAGASGHIHNNDITTEDWDGAGDWGAVAVYLNRAGDVRVSHNTIGGEMDLGVDAFHSGTVTVVNNTFVRSADDATAVSGCRTRAWAARWIGSDPCDPYGVGVSLSGSAGKSKAIGNTFVGWNANVKDVVLERNN